MTALRRKQILAELLFWWLLSIISIAIFGYIKYKNGGSVPHINLISSLIFAVVMTGLNMILNKILKRIK